MIRSLLSLALLLSLAVPATSQEAPIGRLKPSVTVTSDLVRLGDLVEGTGAAFATPVFRAPDIGTTGTVEAARVLAAARNAGLPSIETVGLAFVTVTRASRAVAPQEIEEALRLALVRANKIDTEAEITVSFDRALRTAHVEPDNASPVRILELSWNEVSGRFDAVAGIDGSAVLAQAPLRLSGTATETIEIPVFTRAMSRGEVIRASDIAMDRQPRNAAARTAVASLAPAIGQAVRRPVRAGQPVVASDLAEPTLVNRNDGVTLTCETPGMVLTVRAKALDAGAEGDTIAVLNAQSNRVVQATVTGPGRVAVLVGAPAALN
jgi:flagella basal body P-ring formation protein FlgA